MASGNRKGSGMKENPSPSAHRAWDNDIVLDTIFSHLANNPLDLLKYRGVCHKWNDTIVPKINKLNMSFGISFCYGPEVAYGIWIIETDAIRWARKTMETVANTLTGTAARINFDTVLIFNDFYLTGVKVEWENFLESHGGTIRHLRINIRRGKSPRPFENYVSECATVVSMENLRSAFLSTPNLESLDFCVRFSHYGSTTNGSFVQRMFIATEVPQLQKLTKITIREPHTLAYTPGFVEEIVAMAPNLTTLLQPPSVEVVTLD